MVLVSAVGVSERESQRCGRLVRKNGGAYGEKAIECRCGQDVTAVACGRWGDGSNCLGRGGQRDGLHDHLFDFRLVHRQCLGKFETGAVSWTYLESEHQ